MAHEKVYGICEDKCREEVIPINGMVDIIYPVGSIYMSVHSISPATLFGGTWERFAEGRTLVGVDESDTSLLASLKTGGEKTHTLTSDELPAHKHSFTPTGTIGSMGAHTHTVSGTAASAGAHTHTATAYPAEAVTMTVKSSGIFRVPATTADSSTVSYTSAASAGAHTHSVSGTAASAGAHTHPFSGFTTNTASSGSGSAHNNMQPYITCYMWMRTA